MSEESEKGSALSGQQVDQGKGRIFPCPSCGADLEFHIGQQSLQCPFCGHQEELTEGAGEEVGEQDLQAMLQRMVELRRQGAAEKVETQQVQCESCSAQVEFTGSLTSTECAYCGSPIQRQNVHRAEDRVPVDGIVPFQVEHTQAHTNLKGWMGSLWFAPGAFKKQVVEGNFNGVFLPVWTFDAMTFTRYRGQRGDQFFQTVGSGKNRRQEARMRWQPAAGSFQGFFDDVIVAARRALPPKLLRTLEPWPLDSVLPFSEELLAGYQARTYELPLDEGFPEAKQRIEQALLSRARQDIGGDAQQVQQIQTRYSALTYKHLLLPLWLLTYRFKEKTYQVVINAATGEVTGERPWSAWKIVSLIFLLLVLLLFFMR